MPLFTLNQRSSWPRWWPLLAVAIAVVATPAALASSSVQAGPSDELLRDGADVYAAVCSGCHQPGGVGLAGRYPPLIDNTNLDEPGYLADVIQNGREGELTVGDETFDGVMPPQSTLSDDDVASVIAYIQSGFQAPAPAAGDIVTGPVAGTELPILADYAWIAAYFVVIGGVVLALGPRVIAANERRNVTWVDAWMKTAVIVVGLIVATTIVPAKVLEIETVQNLPRSAQDLIAVGLWAGALVASAWALWYAHRERRV